MATIMATNSYPLKTSQSTALVPYISKESLASQAKKRVTDLFMKSFKAQVADCRFLQPMTVRDRILTGTYSQLENGPGLPRPFSGTRTELLQKIEGTVHATVNGLDYDGSRPYLKILDQLKKGKNFGEVRIDSRNEKYGSTCVGSSHAILKNLKEQHDVDGVLAVQRKRSTQSRAHAFEHGAAIIECSDGFVLLDARSDPNRRIFSIPFGATQQYADFSITASRKGSTTPLILECPTADYEYCTNVGNGDDLVMKYFVMAAPFDHGHEYFPIATYNQDGSDRKFIGVNLKESLIFLKDRKAATKAENITFKSIRENPNQFRKKLSAFMEPRESLDLNESFAGFHIPVEVAHRQLYQLASQEARIQRLFTEAHP